MSAGENTIDSFPPPATSGDVIYRTAFNIARALHKAAAFDLSTVHEPISAYAHEHGLDSEELEIALWSCWPDAEGPHPSPWVEAWERTQEDDFRLDLPGAPELVVTVATFCYHLQTLQGNDPIFLSCRKLGELLGKSHTTAHRILNVLVNLGVLERTAEGDARERLAAEYICLPALHKPNVTHRSRDPEIHPPPPMDPRARKAQSADPEEGVGGDPDLFQEKRKPEAIGSILSRMGVPTCTQ